MSYQKALAFTAVGIGAFLQGCKDDDNNENTDCATVKTYLDLKDGTAEVEQCSGCIADQDVIKDYEITGDDVKDIDYWAKALADAAASDDAAVQALPAKALNACGAVRNAESCKTLGGISNENDPDELIEAIGALSLAGTLPNCPLCVSIDLKDQPACADIKTALKECGYPQANLDDIDCDEDYRCNDVDDYEAIKTGAADDAECKTCLDEAIDGATYADTATGNSKDIAHADFLTLVGYWNECGVQPAASSCTTTLAATDVTLKATLAKVKADTTPDAEAKFNCGVCVAAQNTDTCANLVTAINNCDADNADLGAALACDACSDFDVSGCSACTAEANDGAYTFPAHDAHSGDDAAFVKAFEPFAYCGAAFGDDASAAGQFEFCNDISLTTGNSAAQLGGDLASVDAQCNACVLTHIALHQNGERTCQTYSNALDVCSGANGGTAATHPAC